MKNTISFVLLNAAFCLVFFSCQSSGVQNEPFTAEIQGQTKETTPVETDTAGNPVKVRMIITGQGTMDHLGEISVHVDELMDFTTMEATAKLTVVDSNGDSLFLDGKAKAVPTDTLGNADFTAEETITGGTGKYANASGSSTTEGKMKADGAGVWTTNGTISY